MSRILNNPFIPVFWNFFIHSDTVLLPVVLALAVLAVDSPAAQCLHNMTHQTK